MLINIKSWRKSWMNNTTWTKYKCFLFNKYFCNHLLNRLHQIVYLKLNCFSLVVYTYFQGWMRLVECKYIMNSPITFQHDFFGYSVSRSQKFFFTKTWIAHRRNRLSIFINSLFFLLCCIYEFLVKIFNFHVIIQLYVIASIYLIQTFTNLDPPNLSPPYCSGWYFQIESRFSFF